MPIAQHSLLAVGDSMSPFIKPADLVYLQPIRIEEVRKGDVVLFLSSNHPHCKIMHRVVGVSRGAEFLIAKGDNALSRQRVYSDYLKARAIAVRRQKKLYNLDSQLRRSVASTIAFFSSYGLLPNQIIKSLFYPFLRYAARMFQFILLWRVPLYKRLSFSLFTIDGQGVFQKSVRIKAVLGKAVCAAIDLYIWPVQGKRKAILANLSIKRLDSNERLLGMIFEHAEKALSQNDVSESYILLREDYTLFEKNVLSIGYIQDKDSDELNSYFVIDDQTLIYKKNLIED